MEKIKKSFWSVERIIIAAMAVAMIVVITMATTGAWFTDSNGGVDSDTKTFGTIVLNQAGISSSSFNWLIDDDGGVLTPGDTINVTFTVENDGTADMYVRFKIIPTADISLTASDPAGWETYTTDGWIYYGTTAALTQLNDPAEGSGDTAAVTVSYGIDTALEQLNVAGTNVQFTLYVEAIQAANIDSTAAAWDTAINV